MCEIKNLLFADCERTFNQRINRYNLKHLPDFNVYNVRGGFRNTESISFLC